MERILEWTKTQDPLLLQLYVFAAIAFTLFVLGWLVMRLGSASRPEDLRRRPRMIFGPFTLGLAGALPVGEETFAKIRTEVSQAGYYRPLAAEQFLALRNAIVIGWTILVAALLLVAYDPVRDPSLRILALGGLGWMVLYSTPRLWLQGLARARVQRIQIGLPDALDMLSMCLSGGVPLQTALDRVGPQLHTAHPDVAFEFEIIARQAEVHTLEEALSLFAKRLQVDEISSMAALVNQTNRLGTNVGVALQEFADGIRRSFRQRAEERGNKVSVQMVLPVALCLAPPVYILLLAPAAMELRDFVLRQSSPGGVLNQDLGAQMAEYQQQRQQGRRPAREVYQPQGFSDPTGDVMERIQSVGRPGRRNMPARGLTPVEGQGTPTPAIPPSPVRSSTPAAAGASDALSN